MMMLIPLPITLKFGGSGSCVHETWEGVVRV